jgi:hypothetical protein
LCTKGRTVDLVSLEDLAELRHVLQLALQGEERLGELQHLDGFRRLGAQLLEIVVCHHGKGTLLPLVDGFHLRKELVGVAKLNLVVGPQIPRVHRILPVVVDGDARHEVLLRWRHDDSRQDPNPADNVLALLEQGFLLCILTHPPVS